MSRKTKARSGRKMGSRPLQRFAGPLVILGAAALAVWPLVQRGPSCGPDFFFHFVSWIEAQRSILEGILYPHWASGPNFGAGEPRFVFYPPLTWMAGALLGLVVPWRVVSIVLLYLLFAATGLTNRALARQMLTDGPATLAGCASIFIGNMLVDGYLRADYGELAGGFWIPLLLLLQLRRSTQSGSLVQRSLACVVPLSLVVTGVWLTNGPLGIMASYVLVATAVISAALAKSWAPVARAALSALLGVALAAFYLLPAMWERGGANFAAALSAPEYVIENGWLFSHHADLGWDRYDRSVDIHSWLALAMFGISAAAVGLAWKRGKLTAEREWWIPLALVPGAVLLMQVPVSEPLWNWLPALRYLQFPWRWLIVMNATVAVFFAAAIWVTPLRARIAIATTCFLLFFIITGSASGICFQNCHNLVAAIPIVEQSEGIRGKPEYAPPGIRHALLERDVVANCEVSSLADLPSEPQNGEDSSQSSTPACGTKFALMENLPERKIFMGIAEHAGYLILRLRSYPAWRVTVNGQATVATREQEFGLIAVLIPQGKDIVAADWVTTPDVWLGRIISMLAFVLLIALYLIERKLGRHNHF
jgi:hypothetical protein